MPPRDGDKTPRVDPLTKTLNYVSPSAIKKFDINSLGGCERRWYLNAVQGEPEPTFANQQLGTDVHAIHEARLTSQDIGDPGPLAVRIAQAMLPLGPLAGDGLLVEVGLTNPALKLAGVPLKGFIDVVDPRGPRVEIIDWKTSSNVKAYGMSEEDLKSDTQMGLYAAWAVAKYPQTDGVRVTHITGQTKGRIYATKVSADLTLDSIGDLVQNRSQVVERMKSVALAKSSSEVTPNYASCSAYKGCPFKSFCPRSPASFFGVATMPSPFLAKFKPQSDPTSTNPVYRDVTPAVNSFWVEDKDDMPKPDLALKSSILPPDAPKSEGKTSATKLSRSQNKADEKKPPLATGLRLYVDSFPSAPIQSLNSYIAGLLAEIEAHYQAPDIRLATELGFGKWKGALAALAKEKPPAPGSYSVSARTSEFAQVVIEALTPLCEENYPIRGV